MSNVTRIRNILNKILGFACAAMLGFMSFLVCYQVFMRYVMRNPSTKSEDILSYLFVWVSLTAAALVFGERDHMKLSFFVDKCGTVGQKVLNIFSEILIIIISVVAFIFGGVQFMGVGQLQVSPTLGITMDLIYVILPISGVLIAVYCILNIIDILVGQNSTKEEE